MGPQRFLVGQSISWDVQTTGAKIRMTGQVTAVLEGGDAVVGLTDAVIVPLHDQSVEFHNVKNLHLANGCLILDYDPQHGVVLADKGYDRYERFVTWTAYPNPDAPNTLITTSGHYFNKLSDAAHDFDARCGR